MEDKVITRVLKHLSHGWYGFTGIMTMATEAGHRLAKEDLDRLKRMQVDLARIIEQQSTGE